MRTFINTYLRGKNTDFVKVYKTTGANVLYVYTLEPINTDVIFVYYKQP